MDSLIQAQDLASTLLTSSTSPQIFAACSAVESYLQKHVPEQNRSFFSIAFPTLVCKVFGYDDCNSQKPSSSNAWIDQIHTSCDSDLASRLFNLLSPSGVLFSSIFAVDRHSLVRYIFPLERLPEWVRFVLQNERYCQILSQLCPLFNGRVKEDPIQGSFQIQLNVFEYYMFWFAYYPICRGNFECSHQVVVPKNRRFRLENWTSSLPVLATATRGLGRKTECNLYLRLLYAYLRAFVANVGLNSYQTCNRSLLHYSIAHDGSFPMQSEFLVWTLVHFWLVDSDFSPLPLSLCRSTGVSFPLRALLAETPPTAGLGEPVKLFLNYLNSSFVDENGRIHLLESSGSPRWQSVSVLGNAMNMRSAVPHFSSGSSVESWNSVVQRPLYRFLLRSFLYCPIGASITNASQVFSVWISYLEPWKISLEDFAKFNGQEFRDGHMLRSQDSRSETTQSHSDTSYTFSWAGYVVSNYLFYNSLAVHFLVFAHKFLHDNVKAMVQMVLQLLNVLTSSNELVSLLKKVDIAYHSKASRSSYSTSDATLRSVPSIQEKLQDWEDGLCEGVADGSSHENCNRDLRLFSESEDGGHLLLQLFILRAEHEIRALNGENLSQNLQNLDALRAQMKCLYGETVAKTPGVVISEHIHDQHGQEEIFVPKHPGVGKRSWADVKYKGDWMRRPVCDDEIAWLARPLIWLSCRLNETLCLDQHGNESSSHPSSSVSYVTVPSNGNYRIDGPKEALLAVMSSVGSWLLLFSQIVIGFMRKRGLRINLRWLASKKVVMVVILYAIFTICKKILWMCLLFPLAF